MTQDGRRIIEVNEIVRYLIAPARVLMSHEVYVKDCKVDPPPWSRWVGWMEKDQATEAQPPNKTGLKVSA